MASDVTSTYQWHKLRRASMNYASPNPLIDATLDIFNKGYETHARNLWRAYDRNDFVTIVTITNNLLEADQSEHMHKLAAIIIYQAKAHLPEDGTEEPINQAPFPTAIEDKPEPTPEEKPDSDEDDRPLAMV